MYISHEHKFIYYGPTKVASNTVALIFINLFNAQYVPREKLLEGHCNYHHSIFLPKQYKDYKLITTVRNPFEREISKYNYLATELEKNNDEKKKLFWLLESNGQLKDFKKYIDWVVDGNLYNIWHRRDAWKYSLTDQIYRSPLQAGHIPIEKIDYILKCESLEKDLTEIEFIRPKKLEIRKMLEKKFNKCHKKIINYFPEDCVKVYVDKFKEDFENFNYSTEVPEHIKENNSFVDNEIKAQKQSFMNFNGRIISYYEKTIKFI